MIKRHKAEGFTLIELLTVIAILAVILLISIPIILGVLDRARKNSFKNQVLLYVEALKQQTGMALMGSGYSELKSVDNSFYAPTNDSDNKLVQVSVANLNKVMDNVALTNDTDKYFYVEYTDTGYNYYIGEGVRKEGEFSTTCEAATGNEACTSKTYNEESINLINSKVFNLVHITRNDVSASSSGSESGGGNIASTAPTLTISESGSYATFEVSDDIAGYCITKVNDSGSCTSFIEPEENQTSVTLLGTKGKNYIFLKKTDETITSGAEFEVAGLPSETFENKNSGDSISLGGYNWHVIGEDDTKIWLLMDAGQLSNMAHYNSSQTYSWDTSLIRNYLNTTFYNNLGDDIKSSLVSSEICKDPSNTTKYGTYGGYIKSEIQSINGAVCNNAYTSDKVRLISLQEYLNLSPNYTSANYKIVVSYITSYASGNWLNPGDSNTYWWTMNAYSEARGSRELRALGIQDYFNKYYDIDASSLLSIRPVIVLQK